MKEKLTLLFKALYSNKAVLQTHQFKLIPILFLFIINVSLVSVPNFYSVYDGVSQIERFDNVHEVFETFYDEPIPCQIDDEALFICEELPTHTELHGYEIVFFGDLDLENLDRSTIYFGEDTFALFYINPDNEDFFMSGTYATLTGFDFGDIRDTALDSDSPQVVYEEATDIFLTNIYFSQLNDQFFLIYSGQFIQMMIYVVILSIMFMILNYRAPIRKLSYTAAIKFIIVAMFGPAFLTALMGPIITAWASIMFILIFGLRIMFVYIQINTAKKTFY